MAQVESSEEDAREVREMLREFMREPPALFSFINEIDEAYMKEEFEEFDTLKEKLFEAIEKGKREEAEDILMKLVGEVIYASYLSAVGYAKAYWVYLLMTKAKDTMLEALSKATYYRYLKKLEPLVNQNYEDLRKVLNAILEIGIKLGINEGVSKCKSR